MFVTCLFRLILILIYGALRSFTITVMLVLLEAIKIYYTVVIFNYTTTIPDFLKICQRFYYENTQKFEPLSEYFLYARKLLFLNYLLLRPSLSDDSHSGEKNFVSEVTVDCMDLWTAEMSFIFPVS